MTDRQPKRIWHYTVRQNIESILLDGFIRLAGNGVDASENLCAWFSSNPLWETTTAKRFIYGDQICSGYAGDMDFYHQCFGLIRVEVLAEAAPYDWQAFKKLSGITVRNANLLYDSAIHEFKAKPSHWWVSFEPVHKDKWISIEEWNGANWVPYCSNSSADVSECGDSFWPERLETAKRLNELVERYVGMNVFRLSGLMR